MNGGWERRQGRSDRNFSFSGGSRPVGRRYGLDMAARVVVLASGSGSNLQALLDADLPVVAVVSNRPAAFALQRARQAGIATAVCEPTGGDRVAYDARLADTVAEHRPDIVVLAGWMRMLSMAFLSRFDTVVNLHPALPGELPGIHAIERAWAERPQRTRSGVMVHLVPDEQMDAGPVLATAEVPMLDDDTFDTFAARVHLTEHHLLVATVRDLIDRLPAREDQLT
jgi:phosphoribosylglycinamide formyltransferase 1